MSWLSSPLGSCRSARRGAPTRSRCSRRLRRLTSCSSRSTSRCGASSTTSGIASRPSTLAARDDPDDVQAPDPSATSPVTRDDVGFLLAKAMQRWNELLAARFVEAGFSEVRPSYGSVLLPLYEEDGLRMGELARRARLSKQTMTTMVRRLESDGLVERRPDPGDARASLVFLTERSRAFEPVAAATLRDIDALVRRRLGAERLAELKTALRVLMELD